jgi:hypothetical protein
MRRHFMLGTVFSAALGVAAFAPAPSPQSTPDQQRPSTSSDAAKTVTMTGCLKSGDSASASPTAGAPAGAAGSSGGYILTDAIMSGGATGTAGANEGSPTAGNPPSATPGSTMGSGKTVKLSGSASDLSSLVGKKVEVKGTLQNRAGTSGGGAATSPEPQAGRPDSSSASSAQQLRVTSVKEVAGSCS